MLSFINELIIIISNYLTFVELLLWKKIENVYKFLFRKEYVKDNDERRASIYIYYALSVILLFVAVRSAIKYMMNRNAPGFNVIAAQAATFEYEKGRLVTLHLLLLFSINVCVYIIGRNSNERNLLKTVTIYILAGQFTMLSVMTFVFGIWTAPGLNKFSHVYLSMLASFAVFLIFCLTVYVIFLKPFRIILFAVRKKVISFKTSIKMGVLSIAPFTLFIITTSTGNAVYPPKIRFTDGLSNEIAFLKRDPISLAVCKLQLNFIMEISSGPGLISNTPDKSFFIVMRGVMGKSYINSNIKFKAEDTILFTNKSLKNDLLDVTYKRPIYVQLETVTSTKKIELLTFSKVIQIVLRTYDDEYELIYEGPVELK